MQGKNMRGDKKQKEENKGVLERELEQKLDWYIMEASEEEYDEKAVEYILYLLDSMDPLDEGKLPQTEEAWQRFRGLVEQRRHQTLPDKSLPEKFSQGESRALAVDFVLRHKTTAAVILIMLILAVGGTAAIANSDTGFFRWLKQDITSKRMITSPESLDGETNLVKFSYYDREDVPEWAQKWIRMEDDLELPENYEWQRLETSMNEGMQCAASFYLNEETGNEVSFYMAMYYEKISYNSEGFSGYVDVDEGESDSDRMEVYHKTEKSGETYYVISFMEDNCQYFVCGKDDLEELEDLAKKYWNCVKGNL